MTSNVVATAVEYGIPATWSVWNNGLRLHPRPAARRLREGDDDDVPPRVDRRAVIVGLRDARARLRRRWSPGDVAGELGDALGTAVRSGRPTVVDVTVDVTPPIATGTWPLPPLPYPEPNYPALLARPGARRSSPRAGVHDE